MAKLTEWVPKLARERYGKKYSPNCDTITHLQARQVARRLGIAWGMEMPSADVARIKSALLSK